MKGKEVKEPKQRSAVLNFSSKAFFTPIFCHFVIKESVVSFNFFERQRSRLPFPARNRF